jgi:hypothetical protein
VFEGSIPASIATLLSSFRVCFSNRTFASFVALAIGWILCQGRHSISRAIQAAADVTQSRHHSTLYRFLSRANWHADAVGAVIFSLIDRYLPSEITVIVDDTLCEKSGPHLFGAYMHYDAARSTYGRGTDKGRQKFFAFGHNWVMLAVWVPLPWIRTRGIALPLLFRLYRGKKRCPKEQYRKRTELAAELLKVFATWLPADRPLHVVGDGEYACDTVVRDLPERIYFTGPMVMDAAVFARPWSHAGRGRPRVKGKRLPSPRQLMAATSVPWCTVTLTIYGREVTMLTKTQQCMWYTTAGSRWVRMVVTRDPSGRLKERAFFTTKPESSVQDVLVQFAYRWEIEVTFRNAKQVVGIQDPQNGWWRRKEGRSRKKAGPNPRGRRGEKAIVHTMAVAFAAYALIVIWYFAHGDRKADIAWARAEAPWYQQKGNPSFNDMLASIRAELWAARFSAHPLFRRVREKIRDLLPHWLLAA